MRDFVLDFDDAEESEAGGAEAMPWGLLCSGSR